MRMRTLWVMVIGCAITIGCGGDMPNTSDPSGQVVAPAEPVSVDKNDYPVFPEKDLNADPSVSADAGGAGFVGNDWETNTAFDLMGDPHAVKGGQFHSHERDFPTTFRYHGPNTSEFDLMLNGMVYESLLTLHSTTNQWIPSIATHWQISDDHMTFRYRINPNARFSNGEAVRSEDVIATWDLMMDDGLQDPGSKLVYSKFERPVAESPYIVRVTSQQLNWRNFL